uniref:BTB/POZ domain-containing protein 9 n=1 Tax=Cacopsylla melanoneura TaxID=428564 RepID=A0A8D9BJK5_9HEMI
MMNTETQKAVLKQGDESVTANIRCQFNNEATGNIVFLVNRSKFYAHKSILVLSCEYFHAWFKDGFKESTIEEIPIDVKYTESFLTILKFIYCMDINISALNHNVLCEVLHIVDFYGLTEFNKKLEIYVTKIDKFDNDAVIPLINTAKTRKMTVFYNSLKHNICNNAKLFLEDGTFQDLQYDVLLDLIKCDWLHVSEVDLLKAVVLWYHKNIASECTGINDLNINTKLWLQSIAINCLQFGVTYMLFTNKIDISGLLFLKAVYLAFYSRNHRSITIPDNSHDLSRTELLKLLQKSSTKLKDLLKEIRFNRISVFHFENMMEESPELSDYRDIIFSFRNMHFDSNPRYKCKDEIFQFTFNMGCGNARAHVYAFIRDGFTCNSNEVHSGRKYNMKVVFFRTMMGQNKCRFILESTSNEKSREVFPIYLISQNPFEKDVQLNFEFRKNPKELYYTTVSDFEGRDNLSVEDILNPDMGFIKDSVIIVKVHVKAKVHKKKTIPA